MLPQKAKGTGNGTPGLLGFGLLGFDSLQCPAHSFGICMKGHILLKYMYNKCD